MIMSFADFISFENEVKCTVGSPLVTVWVACEGLCIGVKQQWADIRSLRAHCISVPFLSGMVRWLGSVYNIMLHN